MTTSKRITYRDFIIQPSLVSYSPKTDWTWVHKDYDVDYEHGGHAGSIEECRCAIDEWYDEQDEKTFGKR